MPPSTSRPGQRRRPNGRSSRRASWLAGAPMSLPSRTSLSAGLSRAPGRRCPVGVRRPDRRRCPAADDPVGLQAVALLDRLHRTRRTRPERPVRGDGVRGGSKQRWAVRTSVARDPVFSSGYAFAATWMMTPNPLTPPHPLTRPSTDKASPPRPAVGARDGRIQRMDRMPDSGDGPGGGSPDAGWLRGSTARSRHGAFFEDCGCARPTRRPHAYTIRFRDAR